MPLALYERQNNAMRLVALDAAAGAAGLFAGQSLSDARAICPQLVAREFDREDTERRFADFADWHTNLSPVVAVMADHCAHEDLCLDITGVAHLFGGEAGMLDLATRRLERLGLAAQGAIAPSVAAALAFSRFAPGQIVGNAGAGDDEDSLAAALAPLPVSALRLAGEQVSALREMGLKTIGHLYGRDRAALSARFGASLLGRLDRALGRESEPLTPRLPVPDYRASRHFAEPVVLVDDLLGTAADLAQTVCCQLEKAGAGAQAFHLFLYRVDHKVMHLAVNAAQATRSPGHVARLFANRIDRLAEDFDAGFGIETVVVAASSVSHAPQVQTGLLDGAGGAGDLSLLVDRLASRLGSQALLRVQPGNTHIPEKAAVLTPALAFDAGAMGEVAAPPLQRPLRLLPRPEAVAVIAQVPDGPPARMEWRRMRYRFIRASGPERIAAEWWLVDQDGPIRDYFVAEDETGLRFWLFREGLYGAQAERPRWFIHGIFA